MENQNLKGKTKVLITKVVDAVKGSSEIVLHGLIVAEGTGTGKYWYTDAANCDWVFYENITCKVVEHLENNH